MCKFLKFDYSIEHETTPLLTDNRYGFYHFRLPLQFQVSYFVSDLLYYFIVLKVVVYFVVVSMFEVGNGCSRQSSAAQ